MRMACRPQLGYKAQGERDAGGGSGLRSAPSGPDAAPDGGGACRAEERRGALDAGTTLYAGCQQSQGWLKAVNKSFARPASVAR